MNRFKATGYLLFIVLFVGLFNIESFAQTSSVDLSEISDRAYFEQFVNPGANEQVQKRELQLIDIPHYEIPKRLLISKSINGVNPKISEALEFQRGGELWVRWIPSVGDTTYAKKIEQLLKDEGLPSTPKNRFKGYTSASRSLFVIDQETGYIFSSKAPTDFSFGIWKDKPYSISEALAAISFSDYIHSIIKKYPKLFKKLGVQLDTQMYGIKGLNQAMSIRELRARPNGRRMIPLFSFMDESFGREFARANSGEEKMSPLDAHLKLVLAPWAYQIGQFAGLTGLASDSQHGQNSLIEVDEKLRPTGYVELRDISDARIMSGIIDLHGRGDLLKVFEKLDAEFGKSTEVEQKKLLVNIAPQHSLLPPKWMFETPMADTLVEINPEGSFLKNADTLDNSKKPSAILNALFGSVYQGMLDAVGLGKLVNNKRSLGDTLLTTKLTNISEDGRLSASGLKTFEVVDFSELEHKFGKSGIKSCRAIFSLGH